MTDSTRAYLKKRMALLKPVSIGGLVLGGALALDLRGTRHHPDPRDIWIYVALLAIVAIVLATQFVLQVRLSCPRCKQSLSHVALLFAWTKDKPASCPHCGVSFDEPMPQGPAKPD
jgi:hypothetical protein